VQKAVRGSNPLLLMATLFVLVLSGCAETEPLPPVSLPQSLPQSMKGYELYSWKSGGTWCFTLITGTNRLKTPAEIASRESTIEDDWVKITVEGVPNLVLLGVSGSRVTLQEPCPCTSICMVWP
jgi:hypothetical protein